MTIRQKLGIAKKKLETKILEVNTYIKDASNQNEIDLVAHIDKTTVKIENFKKHLNNLESSITDNSEENEKFWSDYETFDDLLSMGEGLLIKLNCIKRLSDEKREAEEQEKQREADEREREKQRIHELEKLKLGMSEKEKERQDQFQLEKMKIDADERRLKIQADEAVERERMNVEKMKVETEEKLRVIETEKISKTKVGVRLPKLELRKFDGDVLKWREFWDTYESTIHNNPGLQDVDKFKYLKCHLSGPASDLIAGIDITNTNYDIAIKLLEKRYSRNHVMREAHYSKLITLQSPTYKTTSLRAFHDEAEKHVRALESLGTNVNTPELLYILKSKLPRSILERLQQQKDNNKEWTMELFRKELQNYVAMKEDTEYQLQLSKRPSEEEPHRKHNNNSYRGDLSISTGHSLLSNGRRNNRRKNTCIFCEETHWSDECPKYTTISARKEIIKGITNQRNAKR